MHFLTIFYILISSFNILSFEHESYTSITDITFSKEQKAIEISIEVTAHDLSYLFKKENKIELKPVWNNGIEKFEDDLISNYFTTHLKLTYKGEKVILNFVGNEINLDGTLLVYFEADMKKPIQSIEIINDLLISSFPNQQNIVNLSGTISTSYTFNQYETKHTFL
jgi:hypothetical protein